jgi:serine/threonine-protein kinase
MRGKVKASSRYDPALAISAHGIRTHGQWQKTFAEVLSGSPTRIASYDYGRYGLLRFLTPGFNDRKIDEFYRWYSDTVRTCGEVDLRRYDRRPCLAAHSLGTWIACNAMLKYDDIRFDKIILCGSILPVDFDWAKLFTRDQVALVSNECGHRDPWPRWASRFVPGTGPSGSAGFGWFEADVGNVVYDEFGHGEFLTRRHIEEHWMPFLRRCPSPLPVRHGRTLQSSGEFSVSFRQECVTRFRVE